MEQNKGKMDHILMISKQTASTRGPDTEELEVKVASSLEEKSKELKNCMENSSKCLKDH